MAFWNRNKHLSDKELVEGIVKGNESCFEQLFVRYYVVVRKFIGGFIGDGQASEDLAQELFIRLWNRRFSLDPSESVRNYLMVSARNAALNFLKAQERKSEVPVAEAETQVSEGSLLDPLCYQQLEMELRRAISTLPERRRQVFVMSRVDMLPNEEIASRLGLSIRTVEKHIELALKDLQKVKRIS